MAMSIDKKILSQVDGVLSSNSVHKASGMFRSKKGLVLVSVISFIESAFPLPILTDPFLAAAILVDRANTARLVIAVTLASLLGGLVAYFMASFFFDILMSWVSFDVQQQFQSAVDSNESSTFALTIIGAVTPVPYTIAVWVVAVLKGSLPIFIAASVLGRGLRYVLVGYSVKCFGQTAIAFARKYASLVAVFSLILALVYVWFKL